jgi:hypothetical protein
MRQVQHWGVTGWSTEWASLGLESGENEADIGGIGSGFSRVVEPGVVYLKPPVVGDWRSWTESPGSRQRRLQMAWPEDEQPEALTVVDLHERLAPRRANLQPGDDQLRQLDESILEAVRQVDRLHRAGGTLGFVQPDSVMFCRFRDGALQVVFPDVGFAWDDARGLREPKWIAEPQLDCLFEEGARRQNVASLTAFREAMEVASRQTEKERAAGSSALAAGQAADIRMMARLIAVALIGPDEVKRWCGAGRAFLAVPGRDRAPDTQAPVWDQAIAPALLDKIATAAGLLERLELAPPSAHYLAKPPVPPPAWKIAIRRALPGLVGVAGILVLALLAKPALDRLFPRLEPHRLCDAVYSGDPRFIRLDELERARERAQAGDMDAVAAYWELLTIAADLPVACLGQLREEAAMMIGAQALSIPGRLRDEPMTRTKQVALLQQAFWLAAAAEQVHPGSCRRVVGVLLRQLEARGEIPASTKPAEVGGVRAASSGTEQPSDFGRRSDPSLPSQSPNP